MRQFISLIYEPLKLIRSSLSGSAYSLSHEYHSTIEVARKVLARETAYIPTDNFDSNGWNNVIHELRRGQVNTKY